MSMVWIVMRETPYEGGEFLGAAETSRAARAVVPRVSARWKCVGRGVRSVWRAADGHSGIVVFCAPVRRAEKRAGRKA